MGHITVGSLLSSRSTVLPLQSLRGIQGTDLGNLHSKHNGHKSLPSYLAGAQTLHLSSPKGRSHLTSYCPSVSNTGSACSQSLSGPNFRPSFVLHSKIKIWPLIFHPVIWFFPPCAQTAPMLATSSPWIPHFLDWEYQQLSGWPLIDSCRIS